MPDKQSSHKRKGHPDGASTPSLKKPATAASKAPSKRSNTTSSARDGHDGLKERHRRAVSALYDAFQQLTTAAAEGAGDAAASAAFTALLEGAKGAFREPLALRLPPWILDVCLRQLGFRVRSSSIRSNPAVTVLWQASIYVWGPSAP